MKKNAVIAGLVLVGFVVLLIFSSGCSDTGRMACDAMQGRDRDHCLQGIAKTNGDISLCNDIENAGPASKCYVYVAEQQGDAKYCLIMKDQSWYGNNEAYSKADCLMYLARTTNSYGLCYHITEEDQGDATDLNPYMTVSEKSCYENVKCGREFQPACRSVDKEMSLVKTGQPDAFYCTVDGLTTYYPTDRSC
jgi:hypothetical protein